MFDENQTVVFASPDKVGKVFCVLDETLRQCLVCDGVYSPKGKLRSMPRESAIQSRGNNKPAKLES